MRQNRRLCAWRQGCRESGAVPDLAGQHGRQPHHYGGGSGMGRGNGEIPARPSAAYPAEAGTGNWQEGQRFSSGVSADGVREWVNGLGVQVQGGRMLLCVEALLQRGGSGLTVTGILEEEEIKSRQGSARRKRNARSAAENALTLLEQFGFSKQDYHAHINFPGGIPIDGPSAGAAMFLALYSAYTETPVPNTLALTGEIGLHGQILPVGGVEDKLEAAQQAGATLALIPQENWREVYREMEIEVVPVGDAETLLRRVFPPGEGATLSEGMEFLVGQEIG